MKPAEGSTVIGKSVTIRGELTGNEDLYMDGDVEGSVTLREHGLTVGPNSHVLGDIHVKDLIVFGTVTGNLHATGKVDIRHSAVMQGDIFCGRLSIEENATVMGKVNPTGSEQRQGLSAEATKGEQSSLLLEPKA
jgi:cytoskeletal protein CcmA (bactofilin family)